MFSVLEILIILLVALVSYLIGGINASIIVTKLLDSGNDIRDVGSGNAGFTNVLRTKGKKLAIFTFAIDFIKGVVALGCTHFLVTYFCGVTANSAVFLFAEYMACLCCVLGHVYPCFWGFRGGKAILVTWSAMLLIDWRVFLWLIAVFLIVLLTKKIVSLASVCAAVSYPFSVFFSTYFFEYSFSQNILDVIIPVIFSVLISVLICYKHKGNIKRLLSGTEKAITIHK